MDELLLVLFRMTRRRFQAIAERNLLTFPQLIALRHLRQAGPVPMSDLTARLGTTPGALTGLVDRLQEAGFVARHPSQHDRRVIHLDLTPRAHEILTTIHSDWSHEVSQWLARLDPVEQLSLSKGLNALIDAEIPLGTQ